MKGSNGNGKAELAKLQQDLKAVNEAIDDERGQLALIDLLRENGAIMPKRATERAAPHYERITQLTQQAHELMDAIGAHKDTEHARALRPAYEAEEAFWRARVLPAIDTLERALNDLAPLQRQVRSLGAESRVLSAPFYDALRLYQARVNNSVQGWPDGVTSTIRTELLPK